MLSLVSTGASLLKVKEVRPRGWVSLRLDFVLCFRSRDEDGFVRWCLRPGYVVLESRPGIAVPDF